MPKSGESEEQQLITCNRCGKQFPAGRANCPFCGTPFSAIGGGGGPRMDVQEQPELPAWLESLRSGERTVPPNSAPPNFSTGDLIDQNTLPSWLRAESLDPTPSGQYPAVRRTASMPAPNGDPPARGFSANSLIDPQALPTWMQENQYTPGQGNIPAASLVQANAVPDWMKHVQQPVTAPSPPASGTPALPMNYGEPGMPPQGLSANSFVDPQALPAWMAEQAGPNGLPAAGVQPGFSASSLLEMDALPPWLREGGQQPGQMQAGYSPPTQPGQTPTTGGALSAPALIDMNALPEWLRAGVNQEQANAGVASTSPRSFNVPPHVENVRVPSRPRGGLGPREQNVVAANVFASMLGVATPASFPPQPPTSVPGPQALPPQAQVQPQQGMPYMGTVGTGSQPVPAGPPPIYPPPAGYQGGGYPIGAQQPGMPPQQQQAAYLPGGNIQPQQATGNSPGAKPAKRGILETIRSWFPF